ncbi:hypothetical protein LNV08_15590 [Paucibacter sp. TC2R-5]|uniref:hypothetical protein n=1 Tax=Paucibacter sp. TC2R-5 TaxID=2893555 RepID=UPI0021E3F22F|nr:hypothetical protein [Paucibacter sp. TC2R-5]MCV2360399.1 hypothetical protein [Paucibacter sp. TC2R-5]
MASSPSLWHLPLHLVERDGPFVEFKQDAAYVTVELSNGAQIPNVLILYPNRIIGVKGQDSLAFDPSRVARLLQTESDLNCRSSSRDTFFLHHE